jgi:hypothetical protein
MKKWTKIVSSIVIILICSNIAQAQQPMIVKMTKGEAQVTALKGNAEIICTGQKEPRSLKTKDFVAVGCEVSTGVASRLEMVLPDRSVIRFSEKTKFKLIQSEVSKDEKKRAIKIAVPVGKIWTNVRKALWSRDNKFEVSCQNAVAGVRGTVYRLDVESDQSAVVKVYDGEVAVAGIPKTQQASVPSFGPPKPVSGPTAVPGPKPVSMEQWVYIVKSMQQISITSDGQAQEPKDFTEAEDMDDWVKWNKKRDEKYGR